jgi:hypothetical protein
LWGATRLANDIVEGRSDLPAADRQQARFSSDLRNTRLEM